MSFTEGTHYTKLSTPVSSAPRVDLFFSFYSPHCAQFDTVNGIDDAVRAVSPQFQRYHVDFLGPLGRDLSTAWAIAQVLGVASKVLPTLYDSVLRLKSIQTHNDIRSVFVAVGVAEREYDSAYTSFAVKSLSEMQLKNMTEFMVRQVPTVVVNRKYVVNLSALDTSTLAMYKTKFVDVVSFLLTQP